MPPVTKPGQEKYDIVFIGGGSGGVAGSVRLYSYLNARRDRMGSSVRVGHIYLVVDWGLGTLVFDARHAQPL